VLVAVALLVGFTLVGGLGIMLNSPTASLAGWLAFALTLIVLDVAARARSGNGGDTETARGG
jgi:hypothetical protein